jgi:2'-5' RNA ligase
VRRFRRRLDPAFRVSIPAHVTVLHPFAPTSSMDATTANGLGVLFGSFDSFEFTLDEVGWFDERVLYLSPTPAAPFVDLTTAVSGAFPDYKPYGGAFDQIVPHLTIAEGARRAWMHWAAHRVRLRLPIRATATEVWLMAPASSGQWEVHQRFPLGTRVG